MIGLAFSPHKARISGILANFAKVPEVSPVNVQTFVGGAGTMLGRRGASGAAGMAPTSISGIGMLIAASTALASSL